MIDQLLERIERFIVDDLPDLAAYALMIIASLVIGLLVIAPWLADIQL